MYTMYTFQVSWRELFNSGGRFGKARKSSRITCRKPSLTAWWKTLVRPSVNKRCFSKYNVL